MKTKQLSAHRSSRSLTVSSVQDLLARKPTLISSKKFSNPLFFSTFKGVFQLKQARSYFEEHWSATDFNDCSTFPLQRRGAYKQAKSAHFIFSFGTY